MRKSVLKLNFGKIHRFRLEILCFVQDNGWLLSPTFPQKRRSADGLAVKEIERLVRRNAHGRQTTSNWKVFFLKTRIGESLVCCELWANDKLGDALFFDPLREVLSLKWHIFPSHSKCFPHVLHRSRWLVCVCVWVRRTDSIFKLTFLRSIWSYWGCQVFVW